MKTKNQVGFTLVEVLIVLAIFALIGRIAYSGFQKQRDQRRLSQIVTNLRVIEGAKEQLAIQYLREKKEIIGVPPTRDLAVFMKDGLCPPKSVAGEVYDVGTIASYDFLKATKATARIPVKLGTYGANSLLTAP